jgi:hypothetical protein
MDKGVCPRLSSAEGNTLCLVRLYFPSGFLILSKRDYSTYPRASQGLDNQALVLQPEVCRTTYRHAQ